MIPLTPTTLAALGALVVCGALALWAQRSGEVRARIAPFTALLDARYLPLLVAVAPQAYAVYDWLRKSGAPEPIAILGAVGYEAVYVGAIAWADYGGGDARAQQRTALSALAFSVAVAVYNYWPAQRWGALLHAGFPLVAFFYTLQMDTPAPRTSTGPRIGALRTAWRIVFGDPRPKDAPAPAQSITQAVQVNVAPSAPPAHDAPALPEPSAHSGAVMRSASAHTCRKCGASVASQQKVAASARWGCEVCKVEKGRK
jgi:hypothetical protein